MLTALHEASVSNLYASNRIRGLASALLKSLADARTDGGENAAQHRDKHQLSRIARMRIFGDYLTRHGANNRPYPAQPTMKKDLHDAPLFRDGTAGTAVNTVMCITLHNAGFFI
jgi:hypothetical protein